MIYKGYKFRIYPTTDQQKFINETIDACCEVYNIFLDKSIKEYECYKKNTTLPKPQVGGYDFHKKLTILKQEEEYKWLYEYSNSALQQKLLDLGKAFTNFFIDIKKIGERSGYPKFKNTFHTESFRLTPIYFKLVDNKLSIAKLATPIKVRLHRQLPSESSQVTITRTSSGKYYAIFLCKTEPQLTNGSDVVGIDLGVKDLIVTSDNEVIKNPKYYTRYQKKLARQQRRLSRKAKGSSNRNKARVKVAKLHETIFNLRSNFIHKITRSLVTKYKTIVIENLNIKNMSKNKHLSKHILDAGLGVFRRLLTYKIKESNWCNLVIADRWFPSTQLCSTCGIKPKKKLNLNIREWTCSACNTRHHRDFNASKNLANITKSHNIEEYLNRHFGAIILTEKFLI